MGRPLAAPNALMARALTRPPSLRPGRPATASPRRPFPVRDGHGAGSLPPPLAPRPDRFTDHLLDRLVVGWLAPAGGSPALLEALRGPSTAAELERRVVVVLDLAAAVRESLRPPPGPRPVRA